MMRLRQTVDKTDRKPQEEILRHEGQTVDLQVTAEEVPSESQLQFLWTKNEAEIRVGARCGIHPLPSGSRLRLTDLSTVDTGLYRCQVVNSHGDESSSFSLTVEECELSNIHNFKDRIRNLKTKTEGERGGRRSIKRHYQNQHFTELVVDSPPTQRRQQKEEVDNQSTINDAFRFWAVSKRSGRFPIPVEPEHKSMSSSPRSSSSPPPDAEQPPWSSLSPSKERRAPTSGNSVTRPDDSRRRSSPAAPTVPLKPAGRKVGARKSLPSVEPPKVPSKASVLAKIAGYSSTSPRTSTIPESSAKRLPNHAATTDSDSERSVTPQSAPKLSDDSADDSESASRLDALLKPSAALDDSSRLPKVPETITKTMEVHGDPVKPSEVPDGAAKSSEVPDSVGTSSELCNDAAKSSEVPVDTATPSELSNEAEGPSEVPVDTKKLSELPDDVGLSTELCNDAEGLSEVPDVATKSSKVPVDTATSSERPDDAATPSERSDDAATPSELPNDAATPSEVPVDNATPSEDLNDAGTSFQLCNDAEGPSEVPGNDSTKLVDSLDDSDTPPVVCNGAVSSSIHEDSFIPSEPPTDPSSPSGDQKPNSSLPEVTMNHAGDNLASTSVMEGSTSPDALQDKSSEATDSTTKAIMNGGLPEDPEKLSPPSNDVEEEDEEIAVVNIDLRSWSRDDDASTSDRKSHGSREVDDETSAVMSERPTSMVQFRQEQVPKEEIPFPDREVEVKSGIDPWSSYEQFERIGSGGFSEVFRCREMSTGLDLAAKVARYRSSNKPSLMYEIDILRNLCHPRIMRLYDVYDYGRRMYLISEYIGGGELCERIIEEDFLSEEQACNFILQILRGVSYLHKQSIIHLDLKPENIVCTTKSTYDIKIIDFGFAQKYEGEHKPIHFLGGTANFTAPEVINYDPLTFAADVWAVGVMAYLLLCGYAPFDGDSDQEVLVNVTKGIYDYDDEIFEQISPSAREFIDKILVKNPSKRPTSHQLLRDDWLRARGRRSTIHNPAAVDHMRTFVNRARDKWKVATTAIMAMQKFRRV